MAPMGEYSVLRCPHRGQQTRYPFADELDRADAGRFICGFCAREFFVLDAAPLTAEQFADITSIRRGSVVPS
jgi:hypothetical protein